MSRKGTKKSITYVHYALFRIGVRPALLLISTVPTPTLAVLHSDVMIASGTLLAGATGLAPRVHVTNADHSSTS